MFHSLAARLSTSTRELKKIGERLRELIPKNDTNSLAEALQIIETHQNDSEVINYKPYRQSSPLMLACELGKKKIVKKLLATNCIDVNLTGSANKNALELAQKAKQFKIALLLASDKRVNINATGSDGVHPAFRALEEDVDCPFEIAKAIISRPDMDLTSVYHSSSRHHDCRRTILHSLIKKIISAKNRTLNQGDKNDKLYIECMVLLKHVLDTAKVDVNAFEVAHYGYYPETRTTALMMAINAHLPTHMLKLVSMLLAAGADTELRNEKGLRAIDIAKQFIDTHTWLSRDEEKICKLISDSKHARMSSQSSQSMFAAPQAAARPVPAEYLVPPTPQPSAPPAEDDADCSPAKTILRK